MSYLRTPGRGGGRRGPGGSGRVAPGPLPAPHRATQLGPQFPQLLRSGAIPHQRHQDSTAITRKSLSGTRASCRLTQLRCWVAPSPEVSCPASEPAHFLRSRSSVRLRRGYTWPLFLQALCLFRLVRGPRFAAVRARLQSHKAFRASRRQPFRLQAQTVSEQVRHRLRREVSARQHTLPRTSYPDLASEPFRLRPVRPSALPHRRSLPLLQGA